MPLITVREYHVAPNGHQYSIVETLFHSMKEAWEFCTNYTGTGFLDIIED